MIGRQEPSVPHGLVAQYAMGALTSYLQAEFTRLCPGGWDCRHEAPVISDGLQRLLGYSPRADVLLTDKQGTRRLWIEFEVSRADPVANHAKFATSHLFEPRGSDDIFVAMLSSHVTTGRRNLAASTVSLMRHIGMNAFQTVLLPGIAPPEVKRLNHLDLDILRASGPDVSPEVERAFAVSEPVFPTRAERIHFAGSLLDVMLNVSEWSRQVSDAACASKWGTRTVTYFVYDPRRKTFAPSKFCAYLAVPTNQRQAPPTAQMGIDLYVSLDGREPRFDGTRAREHLVRRLAFRARTPAEAPDLARQFEEWLALHRDSIALHPRGPIFLEPPF